MSLLGNRKRGHRKHWLKVEEKSGGTSEREERLFPTCSEKLERASGEEKTKGGTGRKNRSLSSLDRKKSFSLTVVLSKRGVGGKGKEKIWEINNNTGRGKRYFLRQSRSF